jgi:hypothetical protein
MKDLGLYAALGENAREPDCRTLCRSMVVDPRDGLVCFSTANGFIFRHRYDQDAVEKLQDENLRKDYFSVYDPTSSGTMAYNWRQLVWYAPENMIYGVHRNSGCLFRFDPRVPRVNALVYHVAEEWRFPSNPAK